MRGRIGFSSSFVRRFRSLPSPRCAAAFGLAAWLGAGPALGDPCSGIVSPCINDDALWPHAGPSHFAAVGSPETVGRGQVGFGLVTSYLSRPIVLTIASPGPPGSKAYAVDDQVNGTFLWSYGVTGRLELELALPLTFGQSGTGVAPITGGDSIKDTAFRDLRFGFGYAILAPPPPSAGDVAPDGFGLLGRVEVSAPTGDSDQFAGE